MGKYWAGFTYDMDLLGNSLMGFIVMFCGVVCGRLSAGRGLLQRHKLHACPAGAYFSVMKSRQKNFI